MFMPPKRERGQQAGKVRIIAGEWRGRKLPICEIDGLRPTGDRVRETLFNWLQDDIYGARCLDLFAGTGALGFEALSRGARHLSFVEEHKLAAAQIRDNIKLLNATAQVYNCQADEFLGNYRDPRFDLIFIDPPFAADLWQATFSAIERANCLAENALVYVESPVDSSLIFPSTWTLKKSKRMGSIQASLLGCQARREVLP